MGGLRAVHTDIMADSSHPSSLVTAQYIDTLLECLPPLESISPSTYTQPEPGLTLGKSYYQVTENKQ